MEISSRSQEREPTNHPIPSPRPSPRPDNPNPTTFVQADTASFKQVVQMLTGSTPKPATSSPDPTTTKPHPPIRSTGVKKNKLYERRNSLKNGLMINPTAGIPPRGGEILSPSMLNFPGLVLSPVTPLIEDPFERSSPSVGSSSSEEERAIAEKGFYLHPSPRTAAEPRLLPLFPVTSPRVEAESSSY